MFDAAVFSGVENFHSAPAPASAKVEMSALPAGFDAVVQCDSVLLQSVLHTHLAQADALTLIARVPYSAESFPGPIQSAVAAHCERGDNASDADLEIELRLTIPRLTIEAAESMSPQGFVAAPGTSVNAADATSSFFEGPTLHLAWNVELNILRRPRFSGAIPAASTRTITAVRSVHRESRTLLAVGTAVTAMPSRIGAHPDRLQLWLEMDSSRATFSVTTGNATLELLLDSAVGGKMVQSALDALTSQPSLRISPLFAIRSAVTTLSPRAASVRALRIAHLVRTLSNGNQAVTFAIDLGGGPL